MIENQEEITFAEFKAWLAGLIRGKGGMLPDLEDWKAIKETLDKVVPETVDGPSWPVIPELPYNPAPYNPAPYTPPIPYIPPTPWISPPTTGDPIWVNPWTVWCDSDNSGDDDINDGAVSFGHITLENQTFDHVKFTGKCINDEWETKSPDVKLNDAMTIMFAEQEIE